jgi:anti-anti-sigma factor
MPTTVQITPEAKENTYIIHLSGEIDITNLPEFESVMKPLLQNTNIQNFILDFNGLMFIDSKVVGYLAYLHTTLTHSKRKLIFSATNETINDILTLVGLTTIVPQFATVDEAFNSLTAPVT